MTAIRVSRSQAMVEATEENEQMSRHGDIEMLARSYAMSQNDAVE